MFFPLVFINIPWSPCQVICGLDVRSKGFGFKGKINLLASFVMVDMTDFPSNGRPRARARVYGSDRLTMAAAAYEWPRVANDSLRNYGSNDGRHRLSEENGEGAIEMTE